ncbi:hypothetical protein, partial [Vibrio parahaemolyticus]|uniref:hypothetical protein n=1 Tax=Vibrio parahaemolyticus TaxID=670 RepID=UPI001C5953B4
AEAIELANNLARKPIAVTLPAAANIVENASFNAMLSSKFHNAALRCEQRLAILERSETAKRCESLLNALLYLVFEHTIHDFFYRNLKRQID